MQDALCAVIVLVAVLYLVIRLRAALRWRRCHCDASKRCPAVAQALAFSRQRR